MNYKSRIYAIANAHLDTVWNWDFEYTVQNNLKNTLDKNFELFEKYPDYKLNFEGAFRYELIQEYYPEQFEQLKEYVKDGKWNICGSFYESSNTNLVSPETLLRNALYGNKYFKENFGKTCNDVFLPNANGFSWALPSVISHANLKGFSTQKLAIDSAYGVPFDIGFFKGVDGKQVFASLDSKSYSNEIKKVRNNSDLVKKLESNEKEFGLKDTLTYYGVGNSGGAPTEKSVSAVCNEMSQNEEKDIKVISSSTTEFFDDLSALSPVEKIRMPIWNNELPCKSHGTGSYTSRAFSKRISKRNEELADMAERSSVIAMCINGADYPSSTLEKSWKRVLAHSASNDISGTAVERAYKRSWNDYVMSANQFGNVFEGASSHIIKNMDTSWCKGLPVVVSNTIEQDRLAPTDITVPSAGFKFVRVFNSNGDEVPSQVVFANDKVIRLTFLASVPALGYKVFDLMYTYEPCDMQTGLLIDNNIIENYKFIVEIDKRGDISSIIDKTLNNVELLKKPIRFELNKYKGNKVAPAWTLDYKEINKFPWEFAEKGECTIVEKGAVRVTYKVVQSVGDSKFTRYISLSAGCPWVSVFNEIEWREFNRCLHNRFVFNFKNDEASYDLGLGFIKRGVQNKNLYSVPAQKWADLSDIGKDIGVSIFSDSKAGWIMPNERTLRMTILHSPKYNYRRDSVQSMMDFGLNRYGYAIYSHAGELDMQTQKYARFFCQPMAAFIANQHSGSLGNKYQFGIISDDNVIIRAIKKAENSDDIIVRVNEAMNKKANNVELFFGVGIMSATEVFANEEYKNLAVVEDSKLVFDLNENEVKTFSIKLFPCNVTTIKPNQSVKLDYNINVMTSRDYMFETTIPTVNVSIPKELVPQSVECAGIKFDMPNVDDLQYNAVVCNGQTINLTKNKFYFLAASLYGDKDYIFKINSENEVKINVQSIREKVGAWDLYNLGEVANIKTDKLAWVCSHTHSIDNVNVGDELYFFMYEIQTVGAHNLTLPEDDGLIILAATESDDTDMSKLNTPLYDRVRNRKFDYSMSFRQKRKFKKGIRKARSAYQN